MDVTLERPFGEVLIHIEALHRMCTSWSTTLAIFFDVLYSLHLFLFPLSFTSIQSAPHSKDDASFISDFGNFYV